MQISGGVKLAPFASIALALCACGASLPGPPVTRVPAHRTLVEVPEPPPAARVEIVPPKPHAHAVWVDGAWSWEGGRWRWDDGGWFDTKPGVFFAPWAEQRKSDGTLLYGNAEWVDAKGERTDAPRRLAPAPSVGTGQENGS